ncbi:MAG: capsule assembly Wzi family protein [Pseudomonadota bacterium]
MPPVSATRWTVLLLLVFPLSAIGEVLSAPGDLRIRHDIDLLNDTRAIDITSTAWPIAWGEIQTALRSADKDALSAREYAAYERLYRQSRDELEADFLTVDVQVSLGENPRFVRSFENTPRDEREIAAKFSWTGKRFTLNFQGTLVDDPFDGDEVRPDGTFVGMALGNWMLTAGWQERWWGPGRDGSLILGSNHRPAPGITLQRNNSTPFATAWLSWMGPWTLTTFMQQLDDDRAVNDALLFGIRGSIRPLPGLEIGLSRSAQWCGDDRPCSLSTFGDLLVGRDNRGVNVDLEDEPGNQLGGLDIRWALPKGIPVVAYMQWIGEDGRGGGGAIGLWQRLAGLELHGKIGNLSHRTHVEIADTTCREGGFGFSNAKRNCAYEHPIYSDGYRYNGKSIGHGMDGDGLSYSIGSTLVQSAGHIWNISLRHMELNREGAPQPNHTVSPTARDLTDVQVSHERHTAFGRFRAAVGYTEIDDKLSGVSTTDMSFFVQWQSR